MTDLRLSAREIEDVLAGRQPVGRADLAPLAGVAAVLHASREVEPPPPMSDDLLAELDRGVPRSTPSRRRRRHRPRHLQVVESSGSGFAAYRRPLVSMGAAAALLVGLVIVTSRHSLPGNVDSAVSDMGSAIGLDRFRDDSATSTKVPSTPPTTTATTSPPTSAPPSSTTVPSPPATQAPAGQVPANPGDLSWWFSPEMWEQFGFGGWSAGDGSGDSRGDDHVSDGDRDGDGDGRGGGSGTRDGQLGGTDLDGTPGDTGSEAGPPPGSSSTMSPTSTSAAAPSSTAPPPTG